MEKHKEAALRGLELSEKVLRDIMEPSCEKMKEQIQKALEGKVSSVQVEYTWFPTDPEISLLFKEEVDRLPTYWRFTDSFPREVGENPLWTIAYCNTSHKMDAHIYQTVNLIGLPFEQMFGLVGWNTKKKIMPVTMEYAVVADRPTPVGIMLEITEKKQMKTTIIPRKGEHDVTSQGQEMLKRIHEETESMLRGSMEKLYHKAEFSVHERPVTTHFVLQYPVAFVVLPWGSKTILSVSSAVKSSITSVVGPKGPKEEHICLHFSILSSLHSLISDAVSITPAFAQFLPYTLRLPRLVALELRGSEIGFSPTHGSNEIEEHSLTDLASLSDELNRNVREFMQQNKKTLKDFRKNLRKNPSKIGEILSYLLPMFKSIIGAYREGADSICPRNLFELENVPIEISERVRLNEVWTNQYSHYDGLAKIAHNLEMISRILETNIQELMSKQPQSFEHMPSDFENSTDGYLEYVFVWAIVGVLMASADGPHFANFYEQIIPSDSRRDHSYTKTLFKVFKEIDRANVLIERFRELRRKQGLL